MTTELRVYSRHLRACGYCLVPGGREWFNLHELDWRLFVKVGIPVAVLEQFDDHFAKSVIEKAKQENSGGN